MTAYCFDTDVLSALLSPRPPLHLIQTMADVPPAEQSTTAISLAEMLYGAARRSSPRLAERIEELFRPGLRVRPFDRPAAQIYGPLRARLEGLGRPLAEPDLRIASIALSRDLTLVTGNVRHFERVPDLRVGNWLAPS